MTRRREFALLWVSQASSQLGTSISSLAYPLLVLDLTGSALQAGLVGTVVAGTALLFRLPGGVLADQMRSRRLMLVADGLRAWAIGGLALLVASGQATLPLVLAIVALEVAAGAAFGPAEFSLLRAIVDPDDRALAVGRMQSRSQLAGLLGPLLGGGLYGVSPALPFAADAASYLVSFGLLLGIRSPAAPSRSPEGALAGLATAWRWLRGDRFLLPAALWVAALTAVFAAVGLVVIVVARDRGASAAETGLMYAISTAGGLIGALLTPALQRRLRPGAVFRGVAVVDTAATLALLPLSSPVAIGIAGAAAFLLVPAVSASLFGELSRRAPDDLVGRAQATVALVVGLVAPFSSAGVGALVDAVGVPGGILGCAGAFALLAITALVLPAFRRAG